MPEPGPIPAARVLVVDDVEMNRLILCDRLEQLGHEALVATNGREALERMRAEPPELVLLDIMMPELDGFGVLEQMQSDPVLREIPVVMITALNDTESMVRCIESGAVDYLTKPFSPPVLRARIDSCLGRRRALERERALHREIEQAYQRLRAAEQTRDDLFQMIVHDLNNPLSGILGLADWMVFQLEQGETSLEDMREDLPKLRDSAMEMTRLVRSILDVSRFDGGAMPLRIERFDATALPGEVAGSLETSARLQQVEIATSTETVPEPIEADRDILTRVLQNLAGNAIKHSPAGTRVELGLERAGERLVFTVADNGPGIPPEDRERIFDRFEQLETRRDGRKYGAGLGLAFCRMAAEAHGGSIHAEEAPGGGSLFRLELPPSAL